jgi:hypothetical protein
MQIFLFFKEISFSLNPYGSIFSFPVCQRTCFVIPDLIGEPGTPQRGQALWG